MALLTSSVSENIIYIKTPRFGYHHSSLFIIIIRHPRPDQQEDIFMIIQGERGELNIL
jgi:hypothetical protein